jgi:hypothetical protein
VKRISIMLALLVMAFMALPVQGETAIPEKQRDIRRLLEISGASAITSQCAETMTQQLVLTFREARQEMPPELYPLIRKEVSSFFAEHAAGPAGFMERLVPVYDRNFTHAEIRELIAFYQTDLGKKAIRVLPDLTRETIAVGLDWGQEMTPRFLERVEKALRSSGYL